MDVALQLLGTTGLFSTALIILRTRRSIRRTTLLAAWWWLVAGTVLWIFTWVGTTLVSLMDNALTDQLWYLAAMTMLCPFMTVLGARRPGSRVWTGFIILPMLLVLGWPAVVSLQGASSNALLELEDPALVAFGLVTLMGIGNYFGTRYMFSSLLIGAALMLIVLPMSVLAGGWFENREQPRIWATIFISVAFVAIPFLSRRKIPQSADNFLFDLLWNDFRDSFGIVWAKRIQDRVNEAGIKENWPARLETSGFVWTSEDIDLETRQRTCERIDHTLRWLLRRFVDPQWIDKRLDAAETGTIN